ncbi:DedA family protein [Nocardioides nitrophenolicus]|uniref:DedA family protein n=1 Tax=Nocardioides nitrophenolicus TaxID=60489 RepID=UPI0019596F6F|nr:DedA family protein [Nocardioides nitrophenolicus]MBM7516943.1 membrane protein DedA with SNARE-associated domain [Nocardioides nitrophenolicus]
MTALVEHLLAVPAWLAVVVVFLLPALESSVFLGFVFPGELALLLGGVVAGQGHVPVAAVAAAGIAGAAVGDSVGYVVGKRWGRRILGSTVGRFVRADRLDKAEHALSRRGGWAVLIGRFTVALRVLVPGLAGMSRMPYRRFLLANLTGAVLWGGAMVAAGYLAGSSWQQVAHQISDAGLVLTGAVLAFLVGRHLIGRLRRGHTTTVES